MEKSFPPWRAVKTMGSTGRRNVCVRGRISICSVGAGGQDGSPGSLKSRWNHRLAEAEGWSPQCKRKTCTRIRSAAGGLLLELC